MFLITMVSRRTDVELFFSSSFFIPISFAHRGLAARRSILRTIGLIGNRERDEDQAGQISRLILIGPLCCCYDRTSEQNILAVDDVSDRCQFFNILEKSISSFDINQKSRCKNKSSSLLH